MTDLRTLEPETRQRLLDNLNAVARHMAKGGRMPGKGEATQAEAGPTDRAKGGGVAAGLIAAATAALGALKFAKFGKFFVSAFSILVTIWAYAQSRPLPFAVGFVAMIFVHEMGHAFMIKRAGLKAGWPVFIPFVGAFITLKDVPLKALTNAKIGIAGPVAGGLASLACAALWLATGDLLFAKLAIVGCWLNLFNLLPVWQLDGGRAIEAVSPTAIWVGAVGLGVLAFFSRSFMVGLVALVMLYQAFSSLRRSKGWRAEYFAISLGWRVAMTVLYFGLCACLGLASAFLMMVIDPAAAG